MMLTVLFIELVFALYDEAELNKYIGSYRYRYQGALSPFAVSMNVEQKFLPITHQLYVRSRSVDINTERTYIQ